MVAFVNVPDFFTWSQPEPQSLTDKSRTKSAFESVSSREQRAVSSAMSGSRKWRRMLSRTHAELALHVREAIPEQNTLSFWNRPIEGGRGGLT